MVEQITAAELHERLERGDDVQVVDIRPEEQYREGHVPGAENLPFDRFTAEVGEYDWSDDVVLVCPRGESSLQAARLLESYEGVGEDVRVANVTDGYRAWEWEEETG